MFVKQNKLEIEKPVPVHPSGRYEETIENEEIRITEE
jgi:hypothetical protein